MRVTFQYPIFDCRALFKLNKSGGSPTLGNSRYELSAGNGSVKFLKNTGELAAPGLNDNKKLLRQTNCYNARRGIRLPALGSYHFTSEGVTIVPQCKSRKFVPVKDFIGYYEVEFEDLFTDQITSKNSYLLKSIITHYRKLPLVVPVNFEKKANTVLQDPQSALSRLFFHSTTPESYFRVFNNVRKGEPKKEDYKAWDDCMLKSIKTGTPIAIFEISGTDNLNEQFKKVCSFGQENIHVYFYGIKDRINIWIVAKCDGPQCLDLTKEIKSYILSTDRLNQSVSSVLKFLKNDPIFKYNDVTRAKIIESITEKLVADNYFNTGNNYDSQQRSIRSGILGSNEIDAEKLLKEIEHLDQLKLQWATFFLLVNKDYLLNKLVASATSILGYQNIKWLQVFIDELKNRNYKKCLELTKVHRELVPVIINLVKSI